MGGNRRFFDYLKGYKLVDEQGAPPIELDKRYKHDAVKYYARRLAAQIQD